MCMVNPPVPLPMQVQSAIHKPGAPGGLTLQVAGMSPMTHEDRRCEKWLKKQESLN